MDEPLSNLDALLRLEMRAELKGVLAESKSTAIYVTHDQVEAMSLADRISVVHKGRIVQSADPIEVYRNPATRFVGSFIGNPPMNFLPADPKGGGHWSVAGFDLAGPIAERPLEFAIRPEDLVPAEIGIPVTARIVEPLGPHLLVTSEIGGQTFRSVLESDLRVVPGDLLHLAAMPGRARWFDPTTETAIAARQLNLECLT
ncbi:MAG: ABC transporter ATP-binding protein [Paracoccus sp. (in: a-proteobacteria)]